MASSYIQGLIPQIRKILESSDLSKISAKGVRKQLIAKGHEEAAIKENRSSIDAEIEQIYEELTAANDAASSSSEDIPLESTANLPSSLPEPLRSKPKPKPTTVKTEVKTEVKPLIPVPSAGNSGSTRRRAEETDEEMAARLQREFDAEESGRNRGRASRSAGTTKPKKKAVSKKRKSKATVDSDGEDSETPKKRKGGGGGAFNKELILSDALTALLGETRLSRPQTVKRIWEYIKANDLQDPSDKRFILCDEPLRAVFHTDKLHMFTMNKILVDHLRDPDEIAFKAEPKAEPQNSHPAVRLEGYPSLAAPVDTLPKLEHINVLPDIHPSVRAEDLIDSDDDDDEDEDY